MKHELSSDGILRKHLHVLWNLKIGSSFYVLHVCWPFSAFCRHDMKPRNVFNNRRLCLSRTIQYFNRRLARAGCHPPRVCVRVCVVGGNELQPSTNERFLTTMHISKLSCYALDATWRVQRVPRSTDSTDEFAL